MELGIMTNAFRFKRLDETNTPYADQIRACAEAGFRTLDLNMCFMTKRQFTDELREDNWEKKVGEIAELAAKLGLRFSQAHAPFDGNIFVYGKQPDEEYIEFFRKMNLRSIKAAGMLGIPWVTEHPLTDTVHTEYDVDIQRKTNMEFYAEMIEEAEKSGTGIAFENMPEISREYYRRRYCADVDDLFDLVDTINAPNVGICWDFGHAKIMYKDQTKQLRKVGSRLKATHVQDNKGERDSHLIPFVGGNIPWEKVMPVLREINYKGDFVLESHLFMKQIPDALRPSASRIMLEFGQYCLGLADAN